MQNNAIITLPWPARSPDVNLVYLQYDVTIHGLSAALLQARGNQLQHLAFASKTLSAAEQCYAFIERELLAIVFGVERFHTYLYVTISM